MMYRFLTNSRHGGFAIALAFVGVLPTRTLGQVFPNDPRFVQQWGLEMTQAPPAWEITTGSAAVVVAVIDSGVEYTHPDLYLNIWINQNEIPPAIRARLVDADGDGRITFWDLNDPSGVNIGPDTIGDLNGNGYIDGGDLLYPQAQGGWADSRDNRNNGYVDDLIGWDFRDHDNDPMDIGGHGTHVAGIIGAVGNNGIGVAGVNWKVSIIPVRRAAAISELNYAVANGARISNHSYGATAEEAPPAFIATGKAAIADAASRDHLVVASAGNDAVDTDLFPFHFPSGYDLPNVISVAATDRADRLAFFSNYGAVSVDLGAPGHTAWSTYIEPDPQPYGLDFGTSMAAPHVTGAAALILSLNPALTFAEVKALILDHVDPTADLAGRTVTGGRLNVLRAVKATPAR